MIDQIVPHLPAGFTLTQMGEKLHFQKGSWQGVLDPPLTVESAIIFAWVRELELETDEHMRDIKTDYQRRRQAELEAHHLRVRDKIEDIKQSLMQP